MITDQKPLVIDRAELQEAVFSMRTLLDDPSAATREAAQKVVDAISWPLLFDDSNWRLTPWILQWSEAVAMMVDEALLDLPRQVKSANPVWVNVARHFARLADDAGYGTDCRLEFLDQVYVALDRLRAATDEWAAEGVDE